VRYGTLLSAMLLSLILSGELVDIVWLPAYDMVTVWHYSTTVLHTHIISFHCTPNTHTSIIQRSSVQS